MLYIKFKIQDSSKFVDLDKLAMINNHSGIVEFSTANYPYDGMERFIMILAAYDLKPVSCFDRFNECDFNWMSQFEYNTVVATKKNRFSKITNLFKKFLLLIFLLISSFSLAQNSNSESVFKKNINDEKSNEVLKLEKPEFATPENDLLFFLIDDKMLNPSNYNGNIINVAKIYTEYSKAENVIKADTIITEQENNFKIFKDLSSEPIEDRLGINSVTKTSAGTFKLQSSDSLYHLDVIYTLKNNKIVAITEDTSVYINDVKYFYNNQELLVKKTYFNEYGSGVINEAEYNSNGQIISQSSFDNTDGLYVTRKKYTYNDDNLLTYFEMTAALYFVPFENEGEAIEINKVDYLKYKQPDTYVKAQIMNFEYNAGGQLIKVSEERKAVTEESGIQNQTNSLYILHHAPNQLIVEATLPEKRTYKYIFDVLGNPKEITSYVVEDDNTWLHKKTTFKILYTE